MKRLKTYKIIILTLIYCLSFMYFFVYLGNNRLTVWIHHGLWLPSSTSKIRFDEYPALIARLFNLDDWAKTEIEIPKSELYNILKDQQYQYYPTSYEDAEDKLTWMYSEGSYETIPDSISMINKPLSFLLKLKSSRGDFLMFHAKEKTKDIIYIHLYTD